MSNWSDRVGQADVRLSRVETNIPDAPEYRLTIRDSASGARIEVGFLDASQVAHLVTNGQAAGHLAVRDGENLGSVRHYLKLTFDRHAVDEYAVRAWGQELVEWPMSLITYASVNSTQRGYELNLRWYLSPDDGDGEAARRGVLQDVEGTMPETLRPHLKGGLR